MKNENTYIHVRTVSWKFLTLHVYTLYIYIYDSATQKISVALSQHLPWFFQSSSPIRVVFLRKIHLINPRVAGGNWGILPHAGPEDDLKSLDFNDMVILPSFFEGRLFFLELEKSKNNGIGWTFGDSIPKLKCLILDLSLQYTWCICISFHLEGWIDGVGIPHLFLMVELNLNLDSTFA